VRATLSALQHVWDQHFQQSKVRIFLCGSQIHAMESLLTEQSPLFGRMTGQWLLRPLPFGALPAFLPTWSPDELVAISAIVGGVPAYLAWLQPERSLVENLRTVILTLTSMGSTTPPYSSRRSSRPRPTANSRSTRPPPLATRSRNAISTKCGAIS